MLFEMKNTFVKSSYLLTVMLCLPLLSFDLKASSTLVIEKNPKGCPRTPLIVAEGFLNVDPEDQYNTSIAEKGMYEKRRLFYVVAHTAKREDVQAYKDNPTRGMHLVAGRSVDLNSFSMNSSRYPEESAVGKALTKHGFPKICEYTMVGGQGKAIGKITLMEVPAPLEAPAP